VTARRIRSGQRANGGDSADGSRDDARRGNGWSDSRVGFDRLAAEAQLRSAHGFLVDTIDGREVGVVDDIRIDPRTNRVLQLEVCGGWFGRRRRTIDVDEISEIFPLDRRTTVARTVVEPFGR
jgi:hypothetical protein